MDTKELTATCRDEVPFGSWSELKDAKKTRWTPGAAIITTNTTSIFKRTIILSGAESKTLEFRV